jgi:hypothetical protein
LFPIFHARLPRPSSAHECEAHTSSFFLSFSFHSLAAPPSCLPLLHASSFVASHRPHRITDPRHASPLHALPFRVCPSHHLATSRCSVQNCNGNGVAYPAHTVGLAPMRRGKRSGRSVLRGNMTQRRRCAPKGPPSPMCSHPLPCASATSSHARRIASYASPSARHRNFGTRHQHYLVVDLCTRYLAEYKFLNPIHTEHGNP